MGLKAVPNTKPFRFTVQSPGPADPEGWRDHARRAEDLGYSALTVADHFGDGLGPVAALMAAADATETLRIGALVFCNDFRHPAVLAQEAATLDLLSSGRFDLGLGAGWLEGDYTRSGIRLERPGVRIDRLTEAVGIIKALFGDGPVTFAGDHYEISGLEGTPKPTQRPHPPITIGGGGKRILSLAAREADVVALNIDLRSGAIDKSAGPTATAQATDEKLRWVRDAAGERFDDLVLQTRIHLAAISDDRDSTAEELAPAVGLTPDEARHSPHALVGTVDDIVEQCEVRRERWGISTIGISAEAMEQIAPVVERLTGM